LGLVDALNRPGRNFTGIGDQTAIHGKRLQLLKEAVSGVKRVAVLGYREASDPPSAWSSELATAAGSLRVELLWLKVTVREDLESAFATILRERVDGLYVTSTHVNSQQATVSLSSHRATSYPPRARFARVTGCCRTTTTTQRKCAVLRS
jgi:ABC-type uncharacterized transport system substrate-binding protein